MCVVSADFKMPPDPTRANQALGQFSIYGCWNPQMLNLPLMWGPYTIIWAVQSPVQWHKTRPLSHASRWLPQMTSGVCSSSFTALSHLAMGLWCNWGWEDKQNFRAGRAEAAQVGKRGSWQEQLIPGSYLLFLNSPWSRYTVNTGPRRSIGHWVSTHKWNCGYQILLLFYYYAQLQYWKKIFSFFALFWELNTYRHTSLLLLFYKDERLRYSIYRTGLSKTQIIPGNDLKPLTDFFSPGAEHIIWKISLLIQ